MQIAQPARVRETDFTQCSLHALTHPTLEPPSQIPVSQSQAQGGHCTISEGTLLESQATDRAE
jgi:hypothetical protein